MWKFATSLAILLVLQASAHAQLFGSRSLGSPIQARGSSAPGGAQAGRIQGNERFLRGNRSRAEFVGADQRDTGGFVGNELGRASGRIMSATAGLREAPDQTRRINRPLDYPDLDEMYHPRLTVVAGETNPPPNVASRFQQELTRSAYFASQCRFEVSVVKRMATLRGEVTSAKEADLAGLLALFEPGISSVRNNLRVLTLEEVEVLPENRLPPPTTERSQSAAGRN